MMWLKNLNFGMKIILSTVIVVLAGMLALFMFIRNQIQEEAITNILAEARAITIQTEGARNFIAKLGTDKSFDPALLQEAKEAIAKSGAKSQAEIIQAARNTRFYQTIPIVAGWTVGQQKAEDAHYEFRVTRIGARNPDKEANPVEREMLQKMDRE
ncbi:MAG: DUF3365 domain-containing protein, partial [Magnetococcales bacterium]|nr:DUF3365 domain-containing protein [Magnetococcales bacterium]